MAYFWRCPECRKLSTFDDDERPMAAWENTYGHAVGCTYDPEDVPRVTPEEKREAQAMAEFAKARKAGFPYLDDPTLEDEELS